MRDNYKDIEEKIINMIYKPEYLGSIDLFTLKIIFKDINFKELLNYLKNNGWEIKENYLFNKHLSRKIFYEEKERIKKEILEIDKTINFYKKIEEYLNKIKDLWLNNFKNNPEIEIEINKFFLNKINKINENIKKLINRKKENETILNLIEEKYLKLFK
ncbi:MAG: hypothetical protein ACO2OV_03215 [Thermoproteota archaeon]|jgi:hypothetical protein